MLERTERPKDPLGIQGLWVLGHRSIDPVNRATKCSPGWIWQAYYHDGSLGLGGVVDIRQAGEPQLRPEVQRTRDDEAQVELSERVQVEPQRDRAEVQRARDEAQRGQVELWGGQVELPERGQVELPERGQVELPKRGQVELPERGQVELQRDQAEVQTAHDAARRESGEGRLQPDLLSLVRTAEILTWQRDESYRPLQSPPSFFHPLHSSSPLPPCAAASLSIPPPFTAPPTLPEAAAVPLTSSKQRLCTLTAAGWQLRFP